MTFLGRRGDTSVADHSVQGVHAYLPRLSLPTATHPRPFVWFEKSVRRDARGLFADICVALYGVCVALYSISLLV